MWNQELEKAIIRTMIKIKVENAREHPVPFTHQETQGMAFAWMHFKRFLCLKREGSSVKRRRCDCQLCFDTDASVMAIDRRFSTNEIKDSSPFERQSLQ